MTTLKEDMINNVIRIEGGYVNDSLDSGGETNYGVTKRVARAYGYRGKMKNLSKNKAFEIYAKRYWNKLNLDDVELLSPLVAEELFDTGVNMGTARAGRFLQRSLNVLNNRQALYPDLVVDGRPGKKTISALRTFAKVRGDKGMQVLHRMLNALQGSFYVTLAERRTKDERFIFGWYSNRVS